MKTDRAATIALILGVVVLILGCIGSPENPVTTTFAPATTDTTSSTTTVYTTSTSTATTTSTTVTTSTSTTLPRYIRLNVTSIDKCKETLLGKMNNALVDVPEDVSGRWAVNPAGTVSLSCDGTPDVPNRVVYRGGNTIEYGNPLSGQYRLMVKCGHNAVINDLKDCKSLNVTFDTWAASNMTKTQP